MKTKHETLYNVSTILFSATFCATKALSFGVYTTLFFLPIVAYLVFYIICGVLFAKSKKKIIASHILFWLTSFLLIVSGLTFVDFLPSETVSYILKFIPYGTSMIICEVSASIAILLMVISLVVRSRHKSPSRPQSQHRQK